MSSAASYNTIRLVRQDGVVHIAFARAERRNALTHEMMLELTDAFTAINPMQRVPVLILDDGTAIAESMAICRYFDALHPEPRQLER